MRALGLRAAVTAALAAAAAASVDTEVPDIGPGDPCPELSGGFLLPPPVRGRGILYPGSASAEEWIISSRSVTTRGEGALAAMMYGRCVHSYAQLADGVFELRGERMGGMFAWCVKVDVATPGMLRASELLEEVRVEAGCRALETTRTMDWAADVLAEAVCPQRGAFATLPAALLGRHVRAYELPNDTGLGGGTGVWALELMALHADGRLTCRPQACYLRCGSRWRSVNLPDRVSGLEQVGVAQLVFGVAGVGDVECELARAAPPPVGAAAEPRGALLLQSTMNLSPYNATCPGSVPPVGESGYDGDGPTGSAAYDYEHWRSSDDPTSATPVPAAAQTQSRSPPAAPASPSEAATPSPSTTNGVVALLTSTPTLSPTGIATPSLTRSATRSRMMLFTPMGTETPTQSGSFTPSPTRRAEQQPQPGGRAPDAAEVGTTGTAALVSVCVLAAAGTVALMVIRQRRQQLAGEEDGGVGGAAHPPGYWDGEDDDAGGVGEAVVATAPHARQQPPPAQQRAALAAPAASRSWRAAGGGAAGITAPPRAAADGYPPDDVFSQPSASTTNPLSGPAHGHYGPVAARGGPPPGAGYGGWAAQQQQQFPQHQQQGAAFGWPGGGGMGGVAGAPRGGYPPAGRY